MNQARRRFNAGSKYKAEVDFPLGGGVTRRPWEFRPGKSEDLRRGTGGPWTVVAAETVDRGAKPWGSREEPRADGIRFVRQTRELRKSRHRE